MQISHIDHRRTTVADSSAPLLPPRVGEPTVLPVETSVHECFGGTERKAAVEMQTQDQQFSLELNHNAILLVKIRSKINLLRNQCCVPRNQPRRCGLSVEPPLERFQVSLSAEHIFFFKERQTIWVFFLSHVPRRSLHPCSCDSLPRRIHYNVHNCQLLLIRKQILLNSFMAE